MVMCEGGDVCGEVCEGEIVMCEGEMVMCEGEMVMCEGEMVMCVVRCVRVRL